MWFKLKYYVSEFLEHVNSWYSNVSYVVFLSVDIFYFAFFFLFDYYYKALG